jgi:hypothetical protein
VCLCICPFSVSSFCVSWSFTCCPLGCQAYLPCFPCASNLTIQSLSSRRLYLHRPTHRRDSHESRNPCSKPCINGSKSSSSSFVVCCSYSSLLPGAASIYRTKARSMDKGLLWGRMAVLSRPQAGIVLAPAQLWFLGTKVIPCCWYAMAVASTAAPDASQVRRSLSFPLLLRKPVLATTASTINAAATTTTTCPKATKTLVSLLPSLPTARRPVAP